MKSKWIIGIDEAGRGPLAGPVAVGVYAVKGKRIKVKGKKTYTETNIFLKQQFPNLKDSKKCSLELRNVLYKELTTNNLQLSTKFAVSFSSAEYIDKYGIVPAIKNAMNKALKKINLNPQHSKVFLDGTLTAPKEYKNQKTIIKGDDLMPIISAASILAKVSRDRKMKRLGVKFPSYQFEIHKGYGTLNHRKNIKKHGICILHRKTFLKNLVK